jgi:hypothetical protein
VNVSKAGGLLALAEREADRLKRNLLVAAALREVLHADPIVVGGTAEELGARLSTANVRHFPMLPDFVLPTDLVGGSVSVYRKEPTWLAGHAVAEVDDLRRVEGAGLNEFQIHPALALGKERDATADQHGVDPGPVLVDQI